MPDRQAELNSEQSVAQHCKCPLSCLVKLFYLFYNVVLMDVVTCVFRCAVPATVLSHVLGLSEDRLSGLPGSIQRYVSLFSLKQESFVSVLF